MSPMIAAALGVVFGLSLTAAVIAARRRVPDPAAAEAATGRSARARPALPFARLAGSVAALVAVGVATGWPVAACAAALLVWFAPALFGGTAAHQEQLARIDAAAAWCESLRDNLAAAAGLEQTIIASARRAPPALRTEVADLADDLRGGRGLDQALEGFADAVGDQTIDDAVMALREAGHAAGNLRAVLARLASEARAEVAMRMDIHAARARIRTAARVITGVTVAMAAGLVAFGGAFLDPYDTVEGQIVLALAYACSGAGLWSLHRLGVTPEPKSFLRPAAAPRATTPWSRFTEPSRHPAPGGAS